MHDYFHAIGHEPMESLVFRNYVVLNIRFSVLSFLKKMGYDDTELSKERRMILWQRPASLQRNLLLMQRIFSRERLRLRDENVRKSESERFEAGGGFY